MWILLLILVLSLLVIGGGLEVSGIRHSTGTDQAPSPRFQAKRTSATTKSSSASTSSASAHSQTTKSTSHSSISHGHHHFHIAHSLVFPPSTATYFSQVLLNKSLRLLVIGGAANSAASSQTPSSSSSSTTSNTYIHHLQKWLADTTGLHILPERSYIRASPSNAQTTALFQRLDQDVQRDILGIHNKNEKWPNVLLLEHGQDCQNTSTQAIQCVYYIEKLLQRIFVTYEQHHFALPDIVFVDILRVEKYYHTGQFWNANELPDDVLQCQRHVHSSKMHFDEKLLSERAKAFHPPDEVTYNDRGSLFGMYLVEFARFYRYAVLSTSDAWYQNFVHHFLTHDRCQPWPFLQDGHLLTAKGHEALFHIVKHFLELMFVSSAARKEEHHNYAIDHKNASNVYCTDLRFGPASLYKDILPEWRDLPMASNRLAEDYYQPTPEELHRSLVTAPAESWGQRILEEKSLRILTLGGSNTADPDNYVDNLRLRLVNESLNPFAHLVNVSDCYIVNGGIPGWGPTVTKLPFETNLPPSKWPNVIVMEYVVNCNEGWLCVQGIERVRTYYERIYAHHNISMPDIVFLELFRAGAEIGPGIDCNHSLLLDYHNENYTHRVVEQSLNHGFQYQDRGAQFTMQLAEYARFNRYPILSFTDAFFPSAVRFIDSHQSCSIWPFARDNVHIQGEGELHAIHLLLNFFKQRIYHHLKQLEKAKQASSALSGNNSTSGGSGISSVTSLPVATAHVHHDVSKVEASLRIFGNYIYASGEVVTQYRMWGPSISFNEDFRHVLKEAHGFHATFLQRHDDGKHRCVGSTKKGDKTLILAEAHPMYMYRFPELDRPKLRFTLVLGVLHSWNRTYIGSMQCNVYVAKTVIQNSKYEKESDTPIASQLIVGYEYKHQPVRDSTPKNVVLTANLTAGPHLIECENLEDHRLGCISHLAIYSN